MAVRKITAATRAKIGQLVELLAEFLPLSAPHKNAVTFERIFAESEVDQYLPKAGSKKQKLQKAWEEILRRHAKLPYGLIRKIVPAAIDYRRYKRRPLSHSELVELSDYLDDLGVSMKAELRKIHLDETLPEVR